MWSYWSYFYDIIKQWFQMIFPYIVQLKCWPVFNFLKKHKGWCGLNLQELVKKYSEFINFPIYLWASKEIDVEVPVEENEDSEDVEDKPEDEDVAG